MRKKVTSKSIQTLVITAMYIAITAILTFTPIGMIPLPPPLANATTVHIPVLLAVLTEGPWVGLIVGLAFGVCSFIHAWGTGMVGLTLFFRNPIISVLPRMIVPLVAFGIYRLLKKLKTQRNNDKLYAAVAAICGSLTNTVLCLGLIVLIYGTELTTLVNGIASAGGSNAQYLNNAGAWLVTAVGLPNGIGEAIAAAVIVPLIKIAIDAVSHHRKPYTTVSVKEGTFK